MLIANRHAREGLMDASYQFGIEEEYFLADAATRGTPRRSVAAFHAAARARLPTVERELLQSQVEVRGYA